MKDEMNFDPAGNRAGLNRQTNETNMPQGRRRQIDLGLLAEDAKKSAPVQSADAVQQQLESLPRRREAVPQPVPQPVSQPMPPPVPQPAPSGDLSDLKLPSRRTAVYKPEQPIVQPAPRRAYVQRASVQETPEAFEEEAAPTPAVRRPGVMAPVRPKMNEEYDGEEYDDEEYDDDEDDRPIWPRVLLVMLAVLLALCAVLYFIPSAGPLQPVKEAVTDTVDSVVALVSGEKKTQGEALSFQTLTSSAMTNGRVTFNATTSKSVEDVRLENEQGAVLPAKTVLINGEDETNRIWEIIAAFDEPYEGNIFLSMKNKGEWVRSDKSISMKVTEPTPEPTAIPTVEPTATPTAEPTAAPTAEPTAAPTAEPTAEPTAAPTAEPTAEPTVAPTAEPTAAPTAEPTAEPTATPTAEPTAVIIQVPARDALSLVSVPDQVGTVTEEVGAEGGTDPSQPAEGSLVVPTWIPAPTQTATPEPTAVPTPEPTAVPTEVPTPEPTATPVPAPTAVPVTPLPRLTATENNKLKNVDTVLIGGKTQKNYERIVGYIAPNPDHYTFNNYGVLTFRGDNFRRNAAFGNVNITEESMEVLWQHPLGSLRTSDDTLYGVGWTGQPAIVKWPKESREMMNLYEDKKSVSALREVIFGAQDGKIYFLDLTDGEATRDPIEVGYPLKGSVAVDSYGRPLLAVGQGISKLYNKTGDIGLHVFNLIDGKKEFMINGRQSKNQLQYNTNGAFDGTPLFLYDSDAMIVAGENGLLYTVDLGIQFTFPRAENPDAVGSLSVKPSITYLRTRSGDEGKQVSVEASVAMYDKYVYMADLYGILRCVDTDTMKTVWNFDAGDNTDATIALDMEGSSAVSLYTGNTAYSRLGKKGEVSIRKLDALTGQQYWEYNIKCDLDKVGQMTGCKASPVVGQQSIADLVFFTVNQGAEGSRVIALDKSNGREIWSFSMSEQAVSSPVAVYNENGDAWIIQADQGGTLHMLRALTGMERCQLSLGSEILASPAVYKDILVIGTCGKNNAAMYGIKLQ